MNRRELLGAGSLAVVGATLARADTEKPRSRPPKDAPVVVSTWDFGEACHAVPLRVLASGGSTLDAVEQGVSVVEADPDVRSVGLGGIPNRDGEVELDAAVMRGDTLEVGSVAALRSVLHPVSVARQVMERTEHAMLVGDGARRFALAQGFREQPLVTPEALAEWNALRDQGKPSAREHHDTIGMVALDAAGSMAAACTTSGAALKLPGRVGDSPLIGHGLYCDAEAGGAVATGLGEAVIRVCGSYQIVEFMRQGVEPDEAVRRVLERMQRRWPEATLPFVGFVALRADGKVGYASSTPGFQVTVSRGSQTQRLEATALAG